MVYASPDQKRWEFIGTIIHESVHVFAGAMQYVCEEDIGEEAQAYNTEQIAVNLLKDFYAVDDKWQA